MTRPGLNVPANVGLHDLIVENADEYVRAATPLAHDFDRLRELRHTLRNRMAGSALCDGAGLARRVEEAYRWMRSEWCSAASASDRDSQEVPSSQVRPVLPPAPDNLPATSPAGPWRFSTPEGRGSFPSGAVAR